MGLFRRSQTSQDAPQRHEVTLDLIEQVAALRGQVRALESEWDDMRAQIRKGYQRMEKAYERLEQPEAEEEAAGLVAEDDGSAPLGAQSFIKKLAAMRR